jgi:hypothetical protein
MNDKKGSDGETLPDGDATKSKFVRIVLDELPQIHGMCFKGDMSWTVLPYLISCHMHKEQKGI